VRSCFLTASGCEVAEEIKDNKTRNCVTELDDDMEDELCRLWDASMNEVTA